MLRLVLTAMLLAIGAAPAMPAAGKKTVPAPRHRITRSATARRQFVSSHPCPSTGRRSGSCPGYVVDHIVPLACGGADAPGNMQWQTVAAAKAKDKWERSGCKTGK